jgi:hypothetical protein
LSKPPTAAIIAPMAIQDQSRQIDL